MKKLMMDLETKSDVDIAKAGVYRYADSPYFDILLFAYSVDDAPVQVVDLASGEQLPEEILNALTDDRIQKHAFNASFERVCLSVWLRRNYPERFVSYGSSEDACGNYLNPNAWRCTMVAAAYLGLPLSLAGVGAVLQLQQQKMSEGKALIRYFCVPYDHANGVPQFHTPADSPEKWNVFRAYNQRDVETEQAIERRLLRFPVPEFVWQEYALDQTVNDRGIQVDLQLVQQAIRMDALTKDKLLQRMKALTHLDNPNSVYQLLGWLETQGYSSDSLGKAQVQERIKTAEEPVRSVLELRLQLSKASVKKYQAMQNAVCSDGRARGMFQFYGANRTGREAGRIIQLQNGNKISRDSAKKVLAAVFTDNVDPDEYVKQNKMEMVSDTGAIRKVVEDVLAQNEKAVNEYKGGKAASFNFLIGQCMRALRGKAPAAEVTKILKEILG